MSRYTLNQIDKLGQSLGLLAGSIKNKIEKNRLAKQKALRQQQEAQRFADWKKEISLALPEPYRPAVLSSENTEELQKVLNAYRTSAMDINAKNRNQLAWSRNNGKNNKNNIDKEISRLMGQIHNIISNEPSRSAPKYNFTDDFDERSFISDRKKWGRMIGEKFGKLKYLTEKKGKKLQWGSWQDMYNALTTPNKALKMINKLK